MSLVTAPRLLTLSLVFGLLGTGWAQKEPPTFRQSLEMQSVFGTAISPDGAFVAYQLRELDWEKNRYVTQIHLVDVDSGRQRQFTFGSSSSSSPSWSPDGRYLSFAASRDGSRQLYLISPHGGEAWKLTDLKDGIGGHEWSPDGKFIAFTQSERPSEEERKAEKERGDFFEVDGEENVRHIWRLPVPDALGGEPVEAEQLTEGDDFSVGQFSFSPDGSQIAFSGTTPPEYRRESSDLYVFALNGDRRVRKVVEAPGPEYGLTWSPDGTELAYVTANGSEYHYYTNTEIAVVDLADGSRRLLTRDFDEKPNVAGWSREWGILMTALDKTGSHLYRLNPQHGGLTRITGPDRGMYRGFSFSSDYRRMAFTGADVNEYTELHVSPVREFAPKRLTDLAAQLEPYAIGTREVISWTSKDGTRIEGILIKPADHDPDRKYPLLVKIHGGPQGVDRPAISADRTYPVERFLAKGALVLQVNYRGSAGYGSHFRQLNVRNLGVGDYWDVISGVDHLIEKGMVDGDRVGAMGWSQGGYISAFVATYCDRFRAVSMGAGISNWMTYYVNTDIHPFTRQYLRATPWEDPEVYAKTSPMTYIKQAKTPTLIQHGENDRRVPIPNAYEMYQGLQDQGVPVKMFVFRGFGHGVGSPKEQVTLMTQNYEWFCRWIWGETPEGTQVEESL